MKVKDHYIIQTPEGLHDLYVTFGGQHLVSSFEWSPGGGGVVRNLKPITRIEAEKLLENEPGNDPANT